MGELLAAVAMIVVLATLLYIAVDLTRDK